MGHSTTSRELACLLGVLGLLLLHAGLHADDQPDLIVGLVLLTLLVGLDQGGIASILVHPADFALEPDGSQAVHVLHGECAGLAPPVADGEGNVEGVDVGVARVLEAGLHGLDLAWVDAVAEGSVERELIDPFHLGARIVDDAVGLDQLEEALWFQDPQELKERDRWRDSKR